MILGGSTTSLLSLMNGLDPTKYQIDLQLQNNSSPLLNDIPKHVHLLPEDHLEHVYLIEEESAHGVEIAIKELLSKSREELHQKGMDAKAFVLEEKNNVKQAQKLLNMLQSIIG